MRRSSFPSPAAGCAALANALAASVLLASCWAPYYDPTVSSAVSIYRKLGAPIMAIGPVSTGNNGSFDFGSPVEFYPSRPNSLPPDPSDGFLVQKSSGYIKIGFVENNGGRYSLGQNMQTTLNTLGDGALVRSAAANGSSPQLVVVADNSSARQYSFNRLAHQVYQNWTTSPGTASAGIYGLGASLLLPPSTDKDSYSVLYTDGTRNIVSMAAIDTSLNAFVDQLGVSLDLGGHALSPGGRSFQDLPRRLFYYSPPSGPTLVWDTSSWPLSSAVPRALPTAERMGSLLSDGTLVAQGDNYLSAYGSDGQQLFSLGAGSVRLMHEVYYPGPSPAAGNYLIFSQVLSIFNQGSNSREFYVNVWRCSLAVFKAF